MISQDLSVHDHHRETELAVIDGSSVMSEKIYSNRMEIPRVPTPGIYWQTSS
jgi:hypothetical protein